MTKNGYTCGFIESIIDHVEGLDGNDTGLRTEKKKARYFKFPFFNKNCGSLKRLLEILSPEVKIAVENVNTLRDHVFSKVKDRTPIEERSGLIYKVKLFGGLRGGDRTTPQKKRLASHRFDLNHTDRDSTAIAAHNKNTNHEVDPYRRFL